ncbi:uncharacterized protein [Rutidosis leptorrhynchoides]|uniref:uncharacterized protein n=1 Tax=Rutidosis leptorrhynchoides TaxID=125765 RepID=UPI003A991DEA
MFEGNSSPPTLSTWQNIIYAGSIIEDLQVPFKASFSKSIGDGGNTLFWDEHWIGSDKLRNLFPRLFRLENIKEATIKNWTSYDGVNLSWMWDWTRQPSGRTAGELADLLCLLSSASMNPNGSETWRWSYNSNGFFTVKKLSEMIDEQMLNVSANQQSTCRNGLVPKKVEIFIWRLKKNRIPVRLDLDKRGVDLHSVRCPVCDDDLESVDHSILLCKCARDVWVRIYKWWGIGSFSCSSIESLLEDNGNIHLSRLGKSIWQAMKWTGAYLIWRNRNNSVFQKKSWNTPGALNEIQNLSFEWISGRFRGRSLDWLTWLSSPSTYLSM